MTGAPGGLATNPGPGPTLGRMGISPEDEARIAAHAAALVAAMPDLTPAQLARLRRLIRPVRTPARTPRRGRPGDVPRGPGPGPT